LGNKTSKVESRKIKIKYKNKILMKKILSALVLTGFLAVLLMPAVASAQVEMQEIQKCTLRHDFHTWTKIDCPASGDCRFDDIGYDCPMCCLLDTIYTVTDWIFAGVVALVVIFVLMGSFQLLTAAGNPEKVKSGRDFIIFASVGMFVALLAKAIPAIVKAILRLG
jgi:hypothetical protein